ncbi:MAG: replicative DNA helicase, partial [Eubacteriaceae bacterium]|nr:replicative DNA helicase [Eubacteriaceae bacterium]
MASTAVKTPPYSEEAEKSVLGCMMLDKDAAVSALNLLSAEDFYIDRNKWIFRILGEIMREGYAIDSVTIISRLKSEELSENIGAGYIAELQEIVPSTKNIEQYCRIVSEKAALRSIIINFNNLINDCYESKRSIREIIDEAEKFIYELSMNSTRGGLESLKDMLLPALMRISELHAAGNEFTGVATGFSGLDTITNGLQKSDLILLAARPSVGKTALGLNFAQNAAIRGGKTVAFFSLEMSCEQLILRILASETQIDSC